MGLHRGGAYDAALPSWYRPLAHMLAFYRREHALELQSSDTQKLQQPLGRLGKYAVERLVLHALGDVGEHSPQPFLLEVGIAPYTTPIVLEQKC